MHEIEEKNIKDIHDESDVVIGEGTFGKCVKKLYRAHVVAVKYFKGKHTLAADVEKEALMINLFNHPGID